MIKVKEFLDTNFKHKETLSTIKENGHFYVHGSWVFTVKQNKKIEYKNTNLFGLDNCITCSCDDETLRINVIVEGRNINQYNEFTTSMDTERGDPDKFGYYERSTDEEIIQYIQHYIDILNSLK